MQVKDIIRYCAVLLDDEQLWTELDSSNLSSQNVAIKNKLLECLNIINKKIATKYCPIKNKKVLYSNNKKIILDTISDEKILNILYVYLNDVKIDFSVNNGYLTTNTCGTLTITYNILPKNLKYDDEINYYSNKITESVFAYGVVSEYLYIMGNTTEAKIWEEKFEDGLRDLSTFRRDIIMPARRWY